MITEYIIRMIIACRREGIGFRSRGGGEIDFGEVVFGHNGCCDDVEPIVRGYAENWCSGQFIACETKVDGNFNPSFDVFFSGWDTFCIGNKRYAKFMSLKELRDGLYFVTTVWVLDALNRVSESGSTSELLDVALRALKVHPFGSLPNAVWAYLNPQDETVQSTARMSVSSSVGALEGDLVMLKSILGEVK